MIEQRTQYGFGAVLDLPFEMALRQTRDALAAEGFGILCDIDVAATLRQKLGIEMPPYVILGACNPALASQALRAEPDIGLLLPCNVIVYATGEPNASVVAGMDPESALALTGNPAMQPIAAQVAARLRRVVEHVAAARPHDAAAYPTGRGSDAGDTASRE
jgi:uncharacterized protein (DUF302 family)